MRFNSKSFTLMEVLLVSSLMAILGVTVFQSFANGLKLWGKAQRLNREAEVAIFLDKIGEDLRSTVVMADLSFKGTGAQLSFPAVVMVKADPQSSRAEEGVVNQIGAVQYRFDPERHAIVRRQANYAQALKGKWPQEEQIIADGIDELNIHYEVSSSKGFLIKAQIDGAIPSGVMLKVYFSDDNGKHQLNRYLSIPVRG